MSYSIPYALPPQCSTFPWHRNSAAGWQFNTTSKHMCPNKSFLPWVIYVRYVPMAMKSLANRISVILDNYQQDKTAHILLQFMTTMNPQCISQPTQNITVQNYPHVFLGNLLFLSSKNFIISFSIPYNVLPKLVNTLQSFSDRATTQ